MFKTVILLVTLFSINSFSGEGDINYNCGKYTLTVNESSISLADSDQSRSTTTYEIDTKKTATTEYLETVAIQGRAISKLSCTGSCATVKFTMIASLADKSKTSYMYYTVSHFDERDGELTYTKIEDFTCK